MMDEAAMPEAGMGMPPAGAGTPETGTSKPTAGTGPVPPARHRAVDGAQAGEQAQHCPCRREVAGGVMASARLSELSAMFVREFGSDEGPLLAVAAPGRTEIAGNHTDHEGGTVVAGAVDRYVTGLFRPRTDGEVHLVSDGYDAMDLHVEADGADAWAPRTDEYGRPAALVRGLMAQMMVAGPVRAKAESPATPCGFDAVVTSDVPAGSGISSSAAFELAIAQALNHLWADGRVAPLELAKMAQAAERDYFGKPCGLMDQAAVAVGGIATMDFTDEAHPRIERIDVDLADAGYVLCLVAVGADHAADTESYAAVPREMHAVARALGVQRLSEVHEADVLGKLPELRKELGDRAPLRALHFFREERLTAARADALRHGAFDEFLELTRRSGASSAMYLQNVSNTVQAAGASQPAMVVLAVAEELLDRMAEQSPTDTPMGAARIHGGGFGGTVQVFIREDYADVFCARMGMALGCAEAATTYAIDRKGARAQWVR